MTRFPNYAPEYRIRIDGMPIPPALRASIVSVSLQSGLEGADRVEINLANENLRWLDDPLLKPGNLFSLAIGYAPDPPTEVFTGEITGVDASFPGGGIPTMNVVAHDFMQRMTTGTKDRAFAAEIPCIGRFPLPDSTIAKQVSDSNQLVPLIDPAGAAIAFLTLLMSYAMDPIDAKNTIRFQRGESDFNLLTALAQQNGWELFIDHTLEPRGFVLRFLFPAPEFLPVASLKWGASLMDFSPRLSTVGQVAGVSARLYISSIKMELVLILSWDDEQGGFDLQVYPGMGSVEELAGSGRAQGLLKIEAFGPSTAPKQILSELLPRLNNRLTCSGSSVGSPNIMPGKVIYCDGVGGRFGGLYRVTSATHTLDGSGYRTQFEGRREIWFGPLAAPMGAAGLTSVQGLSLV